MGCPLELQRFPVEHRDFAFPALRAWRRDGRFGTPFLQQQPPQRAQVIEDAAPRLEVLREFLQVVEDQTQSLELFGVRSAVEVGLHRLLGFLDALRQKLDVLVSAFDAIEGCL